MTTPNRHKTLYDTRVAARICVRCGRGLYPEDGVRCPECAAKHVKLVMKWERKPAVAARRRARQNARPRVEVTAKERAFRDKQKKHRRCIQCVSLAAPHATRCYHHLEVARQAKARTREWRRFAMLVVVLFAIGPTSRRRARPVTQEAQCSP